ncbi:hypothetical protein ACFYU8_31230 [Brevibacillus sp. NPDC003359]|uniref:phage scaffolding protein n=1 Tax=unclassified Brevibacillus TaxID=2684853 RepID=UPI0036742072
MEQVEQAAVQIADAETQVETERTFTQSDIDAMRTEWERQLQESQTALQQQAVKHAFFRKATEQGVTDADKLMQYVNLTGVTFDENGQPQGIDEIIAAVQGAAPTRKTPKIIGGPSQHVTQDRTAQAMLDEAAERARRTGRHEDRAAYSALKRQTTTTWR